jgi:hypothetical protein
LTWREDADLLELGMRALAIQRWLWGLLILALLAVPGRGLGRGLPKTAPGSPPAVPSAAPEVHVAPFTAPAAMPALGAELARALHAALREANVPARLGKGEEGSALSGRLEEISQTQVRLYASYHGHTVQSVGDLEHLDDLVYAVFTQLRPWLQAAADPAGSGAAPAAAGPGEALAAAGPAAPGSADAAASPGPGPGAVAAEASAGAATAVRDTPTGRGAGNREPGRASGGHRTAEAHPLAGGKKSSPIITASVSSDSSSPSAKTSGKDGGKDGSRDRDDGTGGTKVKDDARAAPDTLASLARPAESTGTPLGTGPGAEAASPTGSGYPSPPKTLPPPLPRPPVASGSPYGPYTADPRRPHVAVHVIGEPLGRVPPGFYGLGPVGQQTLISYLQQRWRIPAVGSRLIGLTGGLAALDQSLRLGARHTLMARLDSLVLSASPTASPGLAPGPLVGGSAGIGGTLSGRLHLVLLLDGKLLLDRSVTMPPTLVLSSETPAQAYSRILYAALDSVAGELYARLVQPPPG